MISRRSVVIAIVAVLITMSAVGVAKLKAAPGVSPNATCNSSAPCKSFTNDGAGPATSATSVGGNGSTYATKFNSTSSTNFKAGVLGLDSSTSGTFDAGVDGTSKTGDGVLGITSVGGGPTVAGVVGVLGAPSGVVTFAEGGVLGDSKSSDGVLGTSGSLNGVIGLSGTGNGILGLTENPSKTTGKSAHGVIGDDASTDGGNLNIGVVGDSTDGIGVEGSSNFVGVNAVGGTFISPSHFPALSIVLASNSPPSDFVDGCQAGFANPCDDEHSILTIAGNGEFFTVGAGIFEGSLTTQGNIASTSGGLALGGLTANPDDVNIPGQYLKNGTCVAGCMPPTEKNAGRGVESYSSQSTEPTIEDFGEAQLVSGQANVALSPDFANVINQGGHYLVFAMPEGDCNGLYIANKSSQGFTVRELRGGHSTIAFEYRIVAKPYGDNSPRLPMGTESPLGQRSALHLAHRRP